MRGALFAILFLLVARIAGGRPNVVVFLADDQGWGDLSIHGNPGLATPEIDSLARDGAAFEHFFVCPVCAPTRAEFLTGRFASRTGVRGVTRGEERLDAGELTIAQVFRDAGYATGIFGKWHNGSQAPYHPNHRGFDEFYGFTAGHHGHYFASQLEHNDRIEKGQGYITDDLTNRAIGFIREKRAKPFFCYIPYCTPHSPMQVPGEFWKRHAGRPAPGDGRAADHQRAALAMVENIDWNVGRVLKALEELDLTGNTIVVYFSDNGPNGPRWNGDMRGIKGSLHDGGTRSPLHIRWPGGIKPGTRVAVNAAAIDLLPTLASLSGVAIQPVKPIDGRDLTPLLRGDEVEWADRMLFTVHGSGPRIGWAVRSGPFRYDHRGELHDVSVDPGQRKDIAAANPSQAALMKAAGEAFLREVRPRITGPDPRPLPVGVAAVTRLPARDGRGEGGVKWSSVHPNSSYFTGWSKTGQRMAWDVRVEKAGRYELILRYTCQAVDVGSRVRASLGERSCSATIAEAFDPPLLGAREDRSPRVESYYKDFKPLSLGTVELAAGAGMLTLEAETVAGSMVADVEGIVLVRRP